MNQMKSSSEKHDISELSAVENPTMETFGKPSVSPSPQNTGTITETVKECEKSCDVKSPDTIVVSEYDDVPGMVYFENVIDRKTESALLAFLYGPMMHPRKWEPGPGSGNAVVRRVQQFGYAYDYGTKTIRPAPPIPPELQSLIKSLQGKKLLNEYVNQIIVNEYLPGQGITAHTDHAYWFGDQICSLSLQSGCKMILHDRTTDLHKSVYLKPRSLLSLTGPARWRFTHAIPATKSDTIIQPDKSQITKPRSTRVSITFRQVVDAAIPPPKTLSSVSKPLSVAAKPSSILSQSLPTKK